MQGFRVRLCSVDVWQLDSGHKTECGSHTPTSLHGGSNGVSQFDLEASRFEKAPEPATGPSCGLLEW